MELTDHVPLDVYERVSSRVQVRATITSHHLWMTTEDAEQDVFCFCKPVAKVCSKVHVIMPRNSSVPSYVASCVVLLIP